jgi:hypothetical protein
MFSSKAEEENMAVKLSWIAALPSVAGQFGQLLIFSRTTLANAFRRMLPMKNASRHCEEWDHP